MLLRTIIVVGVFLMLGPGRLEAFDYIQCVPPQSGVCGNGCRGIPCFDTDFRSNAFDTRFGTLTVSNPTGDQEITARPQHNPTCSADPVYMHSGQFYYACNELSIPGRKLDVNLSHTYYSGFSFHGPFGYGWMINYYMRLHKMRNGDALIVSGDARKTRYSLTGTTYTPPAGRFETLVKNANNTWTLTMSHGDKYQFDSGGKLTAIQDRNGNEITLAYSANAEEYKGRSQFGQNPSNLITIGRDYRLIQITDTNGRQIQLTYNADGLLDKVIDNAREFSFTYDPNTSDLLTITKPATAQFPSGVTKTFIYDASHNVTRIRDAKNQEFVVNRYDTAGRVDKQTLGGFDILFDYSTPNVTKETDRNGNRTNYTFNSSGLLTTKEVFTKGLRAGEPVKFTTTYGYNSDQLKTSETFPKGNGVKYTFDSSNSNPRAKGNLLSVRRKTSMSAADNNTNDIVTTMTYESNFNQVDTITDPKGNTTLFTYDFELPTNHPKYGTKGDLIKVQQPTVPAGTPVTEFTFNSYGQVTEVLDPNNNKTVYAYEPGTGYLSTVTQDPTGVNAITQFTYDANGYPNLVTDAENHTTDYDYDALGWLNQVTDPLTFVTKHTYDANGNIVKTEKQADPAATLWQTTQFTYDLLNHLKTITDPLNRVTTYNYDKNENLESTVDALTHTTTNLYDERNLLFTVTDANSPAGMTRYDYDINGNLAKITDANNNPTIYTFDLFDRQQKITYANTKFSLFDYDKHSNITRHTTPSTKPIDYVYDALNRMTDKTFTQTPSLNSTYIYDLASRMTDANNLASTIHLDYDALNRLTTTTQTVGGASRTLTYDYYKNGLRKQLIYPSLKTLDYTYDANNRLDLIKKGGVNLVDYDYDTLNRRTQKSFLGATLPVATYGYDLANQLSTITNKLVNNTAISTYAYPVYDNVGNRKQLDRTIASNPLETINYTYNNIYELTTVSGAQTHSYAYDKVANRITGDSAIYTPNTLNQYSAVAGISFSYDDNVNLTSNGFKTFTYDEQNRLTTVTNVPHTATYAYDAIDRRVEKTVDGQTTYFIYDNDDIIAEYNAGGLAAEYIHGSSIDEVLTMERGGNTYYYNQDGLGSVTEITDNTGTITESYTYDPYGNPSNLVSMIGNPYKFTGREFDEESGIYHYRARAYDPSIGRFLQRDPLGYMDSTNLFQYVGNNPFNFVDPSGLKKYGIRIVTEIRDPHIESGTKSVQNIFVDTDKNYISSNYWTGTTNLPGLSLPSRSNDFNVSKLSTKCDNSLNFDLDGTTGSRAYPLGNIDYNFKVNINDKTDQITITGKHDGFPSYLVYVDGKQVYDFKQTNILSLLGDADDIKVKIKLGDKK